MPGEAPYGKAEFAPGRRGRGPGQLRTEDRSTDLAATGPGGWPLP